MVLIPINNLEHGSLMIFVLQDENIERLKIADPITMESTTLGGFLPPAMFPNHLRIMIAYESDMKKITEMASKPDGVKQLIDYLNRGYEYVPGVDGVMTVTNTTTVSEGPTGGPKG